MISACLLVLMQASAIAGQRAPLMTIVPGELTDDRTWETRIADDTFVRHLQQRVPAGSDFDNWRELVEEEVHYTPSTLTNYLKIWLIQRRMVQSDLKVLEHVHGPSATLYIYRVPSEDLIVVRKFMQAPDGVYMLAYHARETGIDYGRYEDWLQSIEAATLARRSPSQ